MTECLRGQCLLALGACCVLDIGLCLFEVSDVCGKVHKHSAVACL